MACCGDVPTLETLAAVELLRSTFPDLKVRVDQRRRPDEAAAAERASARPERQGVRRALHDRQADHLRLSRLSAADPSADVSPHESSQPARARLQGGRARRPRPSTWWCSTTSTASTSSPTSSTACRSSGRAPAVRQAGDPRQAHRAQALHRTSTARTCRRFGTGGGVLERRRASHGVDRRARDEARSTNGPSHMPLAIALRGETMELSLDCFGEPRNHRHICDCSCPERNGRLQGCCSGDRSTM